jgi:hypothetical protein
MLSHIGHERLRSYALICNRRNKVWRRRRPSAG